MSHTTIPIEFIDRYPVDHLDQPWNGGGFDSPSPEGRRKQWEEFHRNRQCSHPTIKRVNYATASVNQCLYCGAEWGVD